MVLRWALAFFPVSFLFAAAPASWVPMRLDATDPAALEILAGTPVNCILAGQYTPQGVKQASGRGIDVLALVEPGSDPVAEARRAAGAGLRGVVLEGDFPEGTAARVSDALKGAGAELVELPSRGRMNLGGPAPVVGTWQGVWPGVQVLDNGTAKAAPTGSPWIDTNSGFVRAARAWSNAAVWVGVQPPPKTVVAASQYLQAIADAAMAGGRWIVALDPDFRARLLRRDPAALRDWKSMAQLLAYFEAHAEWRSLKPYGKLALVQDPATGALLSGGILDMIAARHTPVRVIPSARLTPDALHGATMAVNVDGDTLPPGQREVLKTFTRSGGTLLTPPPGQAPTAKPGSITLDKSQVEHLNDVWHDVQSMIGRNNLGARLFNVSSMLSNMLAAPGGKEVVLELTNYSAYPVENVTVHFLGKYAHARLYTPGGVEKDLAVYETEEGTGVDIDRIATCAALRLN